VSRTRWWWPAQPPHFALKGGRAPHGGGWRSPIPWLIAHCEMEAVPSAKAFQTGNMQEYSPEINHGKRRRERERNKAKENKTKPASRRFLPNFG
jgi:hypothetical protein